MGIQYSGLCRKIDVSMNKVTVIGAGNVAQPLPMCWRIKISRVR